MEGIGTKKRDDGREKWTDRDKERMLDVMKI